MNAPETLSLVGGLDLKAPSSTHAELDRALREVFDAPGDRIVWDQGQGRAISAALGMTLAGVADRHVVAVIGDRALSAGMAFEALNHAGSEGADLLVILDDRQLSVEHDLGALSNRLVQALSGRLYAHLREGGRMMLSKMPTVRELARRSEKHLKGMVLPGTLFEEMGFNYIGPVNGHDVDALVKTLRNVRQLRGSQFLHVVSGQAAAHGAGRVADERPGSFASTFGAWLCAAAEADPRVTAISASPAPAAGLAAFAGRFAERYYDLRLAEQHAVTFAAGLATQGLRPVMALDTTLLQRGYDQVVHDVALQELPVIFAVNTDAPSQDLSYLRCLPNVVIMAPADEGECRRMLATALTLEHPSFVRYPGVGPGTAVGGAIDSGAGGADAALPVGRGEIRREGASGLAILSFGAMFEAAAAAAERLDATLVNMRFVKPLDADLVAAVAARHRALVTVEENAVAGGAGCAVAEVLAARDLALPRLHLGIPDRAIVHRLSDAGSRWSWLAAAGLDAAGVRQNIESWWPTAG